MTDVLLWLHIVAGGVWIGTNVVQLVAPRLLADGGPLVKATWARTVVGFGTRIYTPVAIVLLLTGIELVRSLDYSYGDTFVLIGIAVVIIGGVLGGVVFGPTGRSLADAVEAGDEEETERLDGKRRTFELVDTGLVLFTIYAMVVSLGS